MKNDRAVSENTHHMARVADYSREENISMGNIARATKLDSEAMRTIATMTMLYLPPTFVAVSFRASSLPSHTRDTNGSLPL